jgi:hypothetical protein
MVLMSILKLEIKNITLVFSAAVDVECIVGSDPTDNKQHWICFTKP